MMLLIGISVLVGLISSYYLAVIHSRQLLMVIYHLPFRFWRPYLSQYDGLETKYTYELLGGSGRFRNHSSFMQRYREFRPLATGHFRALWDSYTRHIGRDYGIVLVISAALFWGHYWAFIGPFLAVQLGSLGYLRIIKRYSADFSSSLMVSLLLSK